MSEMFETYNKNNDEKPFIANKPRNARLAEKLRLFREECGMTQAELAYKMVCYQSVISKLERGERELKALELFDIAKILNKDVEEFFV